MNRWLDTANVATLVVLLIAVVGAVLVILSAVTDVDPALRLRFQDYIAVVIGAGLLGIGRGIKAAGTKR